jgi:hypothetical protein
MTKQLGRWCVVAGLMIVGSAAGCARKSAMTRPVEPIPAEEAAAVTVTESPAAEPALASPESPETPEPEAVAAIPAPPGEVAPRTDGRPEWWSDQPQYEVERIWVCAEALGPGMAEAKEAALQRARRRMREILRLGSTAAIPGEVVERTSVTPLPLAGGDHSHAGYVLLSAELP